MVPDPDADTTEPPPDADPREAVPSRGQAALIDAWLEVVEGPIEWPDNIDAHFELLPRSLPFSPMVLGNLADSRISLNTRTGAEWDGVCIGDTWLSHAPWDNDAGDAYDYDSLLTWFESTATGAGWDISDRTTFEDFDGEATRFVLTGHGQEWTADVLQGTVGTGARINYCPVPG